MLNLKAPGSLATAAAALALAGATITVSTPTYAGVQVAAKVMCFGVNACKGQSDCKSGNHDCKGQNSCKGQGWTTKKSAEECTTAGGKVVS